MQDKARPATSLERTAAPFVTSSEAVLRPQTSLGHSRPFWEAKTNEPFILPEPNTRVPSPVVHCRPQSCGLVSDVRTFSPKHPSRKKAPTESIVSKILMQNPDDLLKAFKRGRKGLSKEAHDYFEKLNEPDEGGDIPFWRCRDDAFDMDCRMPATSKYIGEVRNLLRRESQPVPSFASPAHRGQEKPVSEPILVSGCRIPSLQLRPSNSWGTPKDDALNGLSATKSATAVTSPHCFFAELATAPGMLCSLYDPLEPQTTGAQKRLPIAREEDLDAVLQECLRMGKIPLSGNVTVDVTISKETFVLVVSCDDPLCGLKAFHSILDAIASGKSRLFSSTAIIPSLERDKMLHESPRRYYEEFFPDERRSSKTAKRRTQRRSKVQYFFNADASGDATTTYEYSDDEEKPNMPTPKTPPLTPPLTSSRPPSPQTNSPRLGANVRRGSAPKSTHSPQTVDTHSDQMSTETGTDHKGALPPLRTAEVVHNDEGNQSTRRDSISARTCGTLEGSQNTVTPHVCVGSEKVMAASLIGGGSSTAPSAQLHSTPSPATNVLSVDTHFVEWKETRSVLRTHAVIVCIASFHDVNIMPVPTLSDDVEQLRAALLGFGYTVDVMRDNAERDFLKPTHKNVDRLLKTLLSAETSQDSSLVVIVLTRGLQVSLPECGKVRVAVYQDTPLGEIAVKNVMTPAKFLQLSDKKGNRPLILVDAYPISLSRFSPDGVGAGWCSVSGRDGSGSEMQGLYPKRGGGLLTYYLKRAFCGFAASESGNITAHSLISFLAPRLTRRGCTVTCNLSAPLPPSASSVFVLTAAAKVKDLCQSVRDSESMTKVVCNVTIFVRLGEDVKPYPFTNNAEIFYKNLQRAFVKVTARSAKGKEKAEEDFIPRIISVQQNWKDIRMEFREGLELSCDHAKAAATQHEVQRVVNDVALKVRSIFSEAPMAFVTRFSESAIDIHLQSKAAFEIVLGNVFSKGQRLIRRPKHVFQVLQLTVMCSLREARKIDRAVRLQSIFALGVLQQAVVDSNTFDVHMAASRIQAFAKGIRVRQMFADERHLKFEEAASRAELEETQKLVIKNQIESFNTSSRNEIAEAETQTRLELCGLEAGDWIAILALKVQLTCAKETDDRQQVLVLEGQASVDLYECGQRAAMWLQFREESRGLYALHRVNNAEAWARYYVILLFYQGVLRIRNSFRRFLHSRVKVFRPVPPCTEYQSTEELEAAAEASANADEFVVRALSPRSFRAFAALQEANEERTHVSPSPRIPVLHEDDTTPSLELPHWQYQVVAGSAVPSGRAKSPVRVISYHSATGELPSFYVSKEQMK